jgi:hypothetical protein
LEIAIAGGNAAEHFGLRRGAPVLVSLKADPTE